MTPRSETKRIMLHCTATCEGYDYNSDWLWNLHVKQNGWSSYGYHWWIHLDGTVEALRDEHLMGAGCSGQNHDTVHVSYIGGLDAAGNPKDTRTTAQTAAMITLIRDIASRYPDINEQQDIVGHNQFAAKACPCFNVPEWVTQVVAQNEVGNPEPGDPTLPTTVVTYIRQLEARILELEGWARSYTPKGTA